MAAGSIPLHALDASIFFANNVRVNYPHRYQSDEGGSRLRRCGGRETSPYLAPVRKLSLQRFHRGAEGSYRGKRHSHDTSFPVPRSPIPF